MLTGSACQAASPGRSRLSLMEWHQGVMMTTCVVEELTPSLPFSVLGTSSWHSSHCGTVRRPCSGARSCLAGVGGAYGGMGSRRGHHALSPGRLLGEQDPGGLVRIAFVCSYGRRAAACPPSPQVGRVPGALYCRYSLPGPFLGRMLGSGKGKIVPLLGDSGSLPSSIISLVNQITTHLKRCNLAACQVNPDKPR